MLLIQRISSQLSASHAVSNRTNSCIVFCGIVVIGACKAGPHVFVTETTRVVLGFLPARPNAGLCRSSRGLKKQSRPISPTPAKSGKVSMRRSRGKGRNSITVVDGPRGAGVEQALTPAWSIRFECECMSFGGTASGDFWESSCEPWVCQNLKTRVEWSRGRLHPKPHSCCLPSPVVP